MATKSQMKNMKKEIASQMGVGHMHMTKGKTRSTASRHMDAAKGPIVPAGAKSPVEKMKTAKKMRTKGKAVTKMHSKNKMRTSKTKQNYGKTY